MASNDDAYVRTASGWTILRPGDVAPKGSTQLRLLPLARGSDGVFLDPFDVEALRTLQQLRAPEPASTLRAVLSFLDRIRKHAPRLRETLGWRLACETPLPRGAVAFLRSQKLIVMDPANGVTYKLLREDDDEGVRLLELEAAAGRILPEHAIPALFTRLDRAPRLLVQPFVRSFPKTHWRETLPGLDDVIDVLFKYYEHHGLEEVSAPGYVDELTKRTEAGVHEHDLQRIADELRRRLEAEPGYADASVVVSQVHGDLIPGHITWRADSADPGPLLIDWSESHRYSVFHDLFYFQFQNHDTDLWDRWADLDDSRLRDYFGSGHARINHHLGAKTASLAGFRLNVLICVLQELDHRLNRLHPRYLEFWVHQTQRLLASYEAGT